MTAPHRGKAGPFAALLASAWVLAAACGDDLRAVADQDAGGAGPAADAGAPDADAAVPAASATCARETALLQCDGGDHYECQWGRLLQARGDVESLASVIEGEPADIDALLRALFPAIGDKPIVDDPLPVPAGLVFTSSGFEPYEIPLPVDWAADPYGNVSWRLSFQSLSWLAPYYAGDTPDVDTGAALLTDWVERAAYETPPPGQSWEDHAIAIRLERAVQLTSRYIAERAALDRRFLAASAQLVVLHFYALAADCCYVSAHNHSMMHDLAILGWVRQFPALREGEAMWALAKQRMIERQLRRSVTSDGVHIENSGCYHLVFLELLDTAIAQLLAAGEAPPEELVQVRDSMIEPAVQFLQPDSSFAQFGDCPDADQSDRFDDLLATIRELGVGDPSALAPLEWIVSRGAAGRPPDDDRVYEAGGYAFFHDGWDPATGAGTVGQFKSGHRSSVHYHPDETGFEIFAHGRELIVGPGAYTYVTTDPFFQYSHSPGGQNILVVDDDPTMSKKPSAASRILAHGTDGDAVWVQGKHANYARLGVSGLIRTFAFVKPDTFVVIDEVHAPDRHDYAQHFHLHPDLSRIEQVDERTIVAGLEGGPSLAIAAQRTPDAIETPRGDVDGLPRGWYFPAFSTALPSYDIVLLHAGQDVVLPVVIVVSAPGQATRTPIDIAFADADGAMIVSWRLDGAEHSLRIPRP